MAFEDINFLNDSFNIYYKKAQKAQQAGDVILAKRNYMMAASTLMQIAKQSTAQLQKVQFERAKRLLDLAERLNESNCGGETDAVAPSGKKPTAEGNANNKDKDDDDIKKWQAAEIPNIRFTDIAGLTDVKKAITTRMINPIKYPDKYALYGKKSGGGVLLYGPPGTGKTMIAKAIACEVGAKFYAVKGSDVVSKWVGDSERNISSLFETARQDPLAIIFVDEMDSLLGQRGMDPHNDRRVNEFLQQMDGFIGRCPNLLLLGATNRPWDIDNAAMRSGRFSQKIYVPLPDGDARKFLIKKHLANAPVDEGVNLDELVKLTDGYSGADIEEICDRAKENPLYRYIDTNEVANITRKDILDVLRVMPKTVTAEETKKFEAYGNVVLTVPEASESPAKEEPQLPPETKNGQIQLRESEIKLLVGIKPQIEFYLPNKYDKVYICIATKNYVCTPNINNWVSDYLDIDEAGKYTVDVFSKNHIGEFEVTFVKGFTENDMDI